MIRIILEAGKAADLARSVFWMSALQLDVTKSDGKDRVTGFNLNHDGTIERLEGAIHLEQRQIIGRINADNWASWKPSAFLIFTRLAFLTT